MNTATEKIVKSTNNVTKTLEQDAHCFCYSDDPKYQAFMEDLKEKLLAVEQDRAEGKEGCTVDELTEYLDKVIEGDD